MGGTLDKSEEYADVEIGNVNILDKLDNEINPATEPTLGSIDTSIDVALSTLLQTSDLTFTGDNLQVDLAGLAYGTLPVEQQTPVQLEDSGNALIDPAKDGTVSSEQPRETRDKVFPNLSYGSDTVSSSGTAEALNGGTSLTVPKGASVRIVALSGNAGTVYVGDSDVTTSNGYPLSAGKKIPDGIKIDDVSKIFVDVDTGGDGVKWIVEQD